jgi:hypothetical protein
MSGPPYRPDLRPMVLLVLAIVVVILGWIVLGPWLLPAP